MRTFQRGLTVPRRRITHVVTDETELDYEALLGW
jgi:hypothetical protein